MIKNKSKENIVFDKLSLTTLIINVKKFKCLLNQFTMINEFKNNFIFEQKG